MNYPSQGGQCRRDPLEHPVHSARVCHVRELEVHLHPAAAQCINRRLRGGVGLPPAVHHDRTRPVSRQPSRDLATDTAQGPCDEVRAVLPQSTGRKRRHLEHNLSEMPPGPHELHRRTGLGQSPRAEGQGLQRTRLQTGHDTPKGRSYQRRVLPHHTIQREDGIADIRSRSGDFFRAPDVALADFDELATSLETGQARLDKARAGQAIQDHPNPSPFRDFENSLLESRRSAVEHMLHAKRPQIRPLWFARCRDDNCAGCLRQLDRRLSHAPGRGVNQDPLARFEPGHFECQHGRHKCRRHSGEFGRRYTLRRRCHQVGSCDCFGPEGARRESRHAIADGKIGHLGACGNDRSACLAAEGLIPIQDPHRDQHVMETESCCRDRDPDLPGSRGRHFGFLGPKPVQRTTRVARKPPA